VTKGNSEWTEIRIFPEQKYGFFSYEGEAAASNIADAMYLSYIWTAHTSTNLFCADEKVFSRNLSFSLDADELVSFPSGARKASQFLKQKFLVVLATPLSH